MRMRLVAGVVGTALLIVGCTSSGGGAARRACDVIEDGNRLSPSLRELDSATGLTRLGPRIGTLEWVIEQLDDGIQTVAVYLEPGRDDQLQTLARRIAAQPHVASTRTVGVQATYADFKRLFKGDRSMLAGVRPEDLPTSVVATLEPGADGKALVSWARAQDDVFEARGKVDAGASVAVAFFNEADRIHWRRTARELDEVRGHPEWARLVAAELRDALGRGTKAVSSDASLAERNHRAAELLAAASRRCSAD